MVVDPEKVIVALDVEDRQACQNLLTKLSGKVRSVKIGPVLFHREGPALLQWLSSAGVGIFLDMKFHDIPNTVAGAVEAACEIAPLQFLTVHASGGRKMISFAKDAIQKIAPNHRPKLLAVTVLTSLDQSDLREAGVDSTVGEQVKRLAKLAVDSGADGIVCSPLEISLVRESIGREKLIVVPGIRSPEDKTADQKRSASAGEAFRAGADYVVVGRPITQAADPRAAMEKIISEK